MNKPIAFIIGAGKNIGANTAQALQSKGYRIALAARSLKQEDSTSETLHLTLDLSKPDSVSPAFASLRKQWGEPSVVFYNAAAAHYTSPSDPLAPSLEDFALDLAINTTSLYAAIKESLASFDALPPTSTSSSQSPSSSSSSSSSTNNNNNKTFLYTGNILNTGPRPSLLTLGVGKVASAQILELAAGAYGEGEKKKGYGFYYVDERKADGSSKGLGIDGAAHGDFVAEIVERGGTGGGKAEVPWHATFVAGVGYVRFD